MAARYREKRTSITTVRDQYLSSATFPAPFIFHYPLPLMSLCAFSYYTYFPYAPSPTTLTFIPRILLMRLMKEEGAERKCHFEKSCGTEKAKFQNKS
jgi:hypothetical protein